MPSDLHSMILRAVSPFDQGVAGLNVCVLRQSDGLPLRPKRTAAVLVPILDTPDPEIILTVRSVSLAQHPGQVSFPGGSVEQGDHSAISTALREAEEEIGLDHSQVSPIGFLDRLDTNSDFRVLPVVGLVKPPFIGQTDQREVAEVFTVPLRLATNPDEYSREKISYCNQPRVISSLHWQGHKIWGVTAAILLNLGTRMASSA